MNGKVVYLTGLAVALLGLAEARAQLPASLAPVTGTPPVPVLPDLPARGPAGPVGASCPNTDPMVTALPSLGPPAYGAAGPTVAPGLTSWITYPRAPGCCAPVGRDGPIGSEFYLRAGASLPLGGTILPRTLETGWTIGGGGRVLLFNTEVDRAWTMDLGLSNTSYNAADRSRTAILRNVPIRTSNFGQTQTEIAPFVIVTPLDYNQTFVNLSLGREWWLVGNAATPGGWLWRAGFDAGGRWGSAKMHTVELQHFTDVIGGVFLALHTGLEIPLGACVLHCGGRFEYGYTWSDILQRQNNADLRSVNFLGAIGLRY